MELVYLWVEKYKNIEKQGFNFSPRFECTKEDVKNFAFCSYLDKKDINKRNHAKLTQDILNQFKLIK